MHLLTNKDIHFCFVIASFNNHANIEKNLNSVLEQSYPHWRVLYTNDCSTDTTHEMFQAIMEKHPHLRHKFTYIRNDTQQGQMQNKYHMYTLVRDLEVVCILDGDDWLLHSDVLQILKEHYQTDTKLCTSNYRTFFNHELISYIPSMKFYRTDELHMTRYNPEWLFKHLKTGYGILFKSIPKSYLQIQGKWLTCCTDCAEMHSACEFSCGKTSQIEQPLYVYNKDNSVLYKNSYYTTSLEHILERTNALSFVRSLPPCKYEWPVTYVINLAKEVELKQNMKMQLKWMQNTNYTFIEAVDGNVSNLRLYEEYLHYERVKIPNTILYYNVTKQHITRKSLGLLSSVFIVLRQFVQSGLSHMVLFEDDVFSHKDLSYYFFLHETVLQDKDLVYLGCHHNHHKIYDWVNNQDVFIDIQKVPFLIYGAYSLILSRKLATFILSFGLESIVRMNLSWDLFLNYVREQNQHSFYLYFKQLFIPNVCKYGGINEFRDQSFYAERNIHIHEYHTLWDNTRYTPRYTPQYTQFIANMTKYKRFKI